MFDASPFTISSAVVSSDNSSNTIAVIPTSGAPTTCPGTGSIKVTSGGSKSSRRNAKSCSSGRASSMCPVYAPGTPLMACPARTSSGR